MDLPGVDQNSIDITIEKNILTVNGYTAAESPEGYALIFAEYEVGDFERSFRLSEEIDREKIEATIQDGVLTLTLPKLDTAKSRKVKVKSG
jgi:HSP20 family molecular chaperone IbpA